MVVTATYSDNSTAVITNYTIDETTPLTEGQTTLKVYINGLPRIWDTQSITVIERKITSIAITTPPTKTNYVEGENFNPAGMVITAMYSDVGTEEITDYTMSNNTNLALGQNNIIIHYSVNGRPESWALTQPITVIAKTLTKIEVTTVPTDINYVAGQNFDSTGMVVTATYDNGKTAPITTYTITDGTNLTTGKTTVTITYTEGTTTKTVTQAINVVAKVVTKIEVTTPPTDVNYVNGQNFDATGMVVTATYNDTTTAAVTTYTVTDGTNLTTGKTTVNIQYSINGGQQTWVTTTPITVVARAISSIAITTPPVKTSYKIGQNFTNAGMVVTATYNDTTTEVITAYTITDGTSLTEGKTSVTIQLDSNHAITTTQSIIVEQKEVISIAVTTAPTKINYYYDEPNTSTFDPAGMIVTATYDDNSTAEIPNTKYTIIGAGQVLPIGVSNVVIRYNGNTSITATQSVTNTLRAVVSIAVTHAPTKTTYIEGQDFDDTGMVIVATYNDGSQEFLATTDTDSIPEDWPDFNNNNTNTNTSNNVVVNNTNNSTNTNTNISNNVVVNNTNNSNNTNTIGGEETVPPVEGSTSTPLPCTIIDAKSLELGQTTVTIQLNSNHAITTTQSITVEAKVITGIEVTTAPTKTSYVVGQNFATAGMVVTATYNDTTTETTTAYTVTDGASLTTGKTSVTIQLDSNHAIITTQNITVVAKAIVSIAVTTPPTKTAYVVGQDFDSTGMVVTAIYNDNVNPTVIPNTLYTVTDGTNLTTGKTSVRILYAPDGEGPALTTTQSITVEERAIASIAVTHAPTKGVYIEGQDFDSTGMVVTATYNDTTIETTTAYTVIDGTNLTTGLTEVTIQLNSNHAITTTRTIIVEARAIASIAVTTPPTKTAYVVGQDFDSTGMVVTATYNDTTTETTTAYTVTDGTSLTTGKTTVRLQLNSNHAITITQTITVTTITDDLTVTQYGVTEGTPNYITQISPNTVLTTFTGHITTAAEIAVMNGETQIEATDKIGTGMELVLTIGEEEVRYVLVVKGDTNGDGLANGQDALAILNHRASIHILVGEYFKAADLNGDYIINGIDALALLNHRAGIAGHEL